MDNSDWCSWSEDWICFLPKNCKSISITHDGFSSERYGTRWANSLAFRSFAMHASLFPTGIVSQEDLDYTRHRHEPLSVENGSSESKWQLKWPSAVCVVPADLPVWYFPPHLTVWTFFIPEYQQLIQMWICTAVCQEFLMAFFFIWMHQRKVTSGNF